MLNITKVELERISDAGMYLFFEKGMRGGVCYISRRCSEANNKYLKSYDLKQNNILFIRMQTIYMVMQCLNFFQQIDQMDRP